MDLESPDQVCKIPLLQKGSSREVNDVHLFVHMNEYVSTC
jgi:hypothetical protein